ncbi:MAG: response regulator [Desulfuromonadales bacterium]|nr:response regulator [Desulfuromonadales bacterium]
MAQRILIAEDHQPLAESLLQLLKNRGYQAEHAADGIAALRTIAAAPPDLLLLDLKLPGLHGVELLKKLRQSPRTAQLPVIIVSGVYKGDQYHQAGAALGVRHYLEKPFKAGDLLSAISQCLPAAPAIVQAATQAATTQPAPPSRPFYQHLQEAFHKRFSGQLLLNWPDARRMLSFINGAPAALRPGFQHRDFGDYLRAHGAISAEEYAYFANHGAFRHEVLIQMGCLSYGDLLDAKFAYLNQELEQAFGAPPAQANWQAMPVPELMQLVTLNVPQLFYRGFRRFPGRGADQLLATCLGKYPTPANAFYQHINFLTLDDEARLFLKQLDGRHTLADCPGDPTAHAPLLLTLVALNMLRFADQPTEPVGIGDLPLRTLFNAVIEEAAVEVDLPLESFTDLVEEAAEEPLAAPAPPATATAVEAAAATEDLAQSVRLMAKSLEGKDHYEVFGIKPGKFSVDLLKERYFAVTRQFGPDILMQLSGADATLVEEILATVANAYNTLSDVVKKERYDELLGADKIGLGHKGDDRFQAQVQAESGKVFIDMEEWDNAEKALQEAVNFDSGSGDYLAHLAWAIYRNPKNAASRVMQEKARQMLNRAITMERTAPAFAFKGWVLLESDQDALAEAEFNKALKLDARSMQARRGLRVLQEKKEQQKKGLFGRMFK